MEPILSSRCLVGYSRSSPSPFPFVECFSIIPLTSALGDQVFSVQNRIGLASNVTKRVPSMYF